MSNSTDKLSQTELQQFMDGQWIIFFNVTLNGIDTRFYFTKYYQTIQRPRFSCKKFCLFDGIIECNKVLDKIMNYIQEYGLIVSDYKTHQSIYLEPTEIHLKIGKLDGK